MLHIIFWRSLSLVGFYAVHHNASAWTDILARLKIDAAQFVVMHAEDILIDIRNRESVTEVLFENLIGSYFSLAHPSV